jgi:hypothetical protein
MLHCILRGFCSLRTGHHWGNIHEIAERTAGSVPATPKQTTIIMGVIATLWVTLTKYQTITLNMNSSVLLPLTSSSPDNGCRLVYNNLLRT